MLFPYLMGQLIGKDSTNGIPSITQSLPVPTQWIDLNVTSTLITVMILVFGAQAIFSFFRVYLFGYFTANSLKDLRVAAFSVLIASPLHFI